VYEPAWIGLGILASLVLVGIAYLIGRAIWGRVEPGDPDPGGRTAPARSSFGSPMAVDSLRMLRRMRQRRNRNG